MGFDKKAQAFLDKKATNDSIDAAEGLMSAQDLAASFEQARGTSLVDTYTGDVGSGIGRFEKSKYDLNLDPTRLESISQEELGYERAEAQTTGDLLIEGMKSFGAEAILGTAEGLTRLADLPEIGAVFTGESTNYTNWAAEYLSSLKEDLSGEVYSARDENFLSGSFWAKNAGTMASTITIMVPGMAATKGLSLLGKSLGAGNKILKLAKVLKMDPSKVLANANMLGQTLITRHIESQMEAMGTVAAMKQQLDSGEITNGIYELQDGTVIDLSKQKSSELTEDQKNEIAGEAGRSNYIANAPMMLQDFVQLSAISKMLKVSKGSKAAVNSMKKLEKDLANSKGLRRWAMGLGELGGVGISEGLEEGYQNITNAWSMQNTMAEHGLANYESLGSTIDRATAEDGFAEAVVLGAFGGVLFGGGGKVINQVKGGNANKIKNLEIQMSMAKIADTAYNNTVKQSLLNPNLKDINTYGSIIANVSNSVSQGNIERGIRDAEDILSKTDEEIKTGNEDIKDVKEYRKNLTEYVSILKDANEEMRSHVADNAIRQYSAGRLYGTSKKVQTKIDEARAKLTEEFEVKDKTKMSPEERQSYNNDRATFLEEQEAAKKTIAKYADSYDNAIEDLAVKKVLNASLTAKMVNRLNKKSKESYKEIKEDLINKSDYDKQAIEDLIDKTKDIYIKANKHLTSEVKKAQKEGRKLSSGDVADIFNSVYKGGIEDILSKTKSESFDSKKAYLEEIYPGLGIGSEVSTLSEMTTTSGFRDKSIEEANRVAKLFKTQEGREQLRDELGKTIEQVTEDKLEDNQPIFEQAIDETELEAAFESAFGKNFLGNKKLKKNFDKHVKRLNKKDVVEETEETEKEETTPAPSGLLTKKIEKPIETATEVKETPKVDTKVISGMVTIKADRFDESRESSGLFLATPTESKIKSSSLIDHTAASKPLLNKKGKQVAGSVKGTLELTEHNGKNVILLKDSSGKVISVLEETTDNKQLVNAVKDSGKVEVTYTKQSRSSDIIKVLGMETPLNNLGDNNLPKVDGKPTVFIGNFYSETANSTASTSMFMHDADGKMYPEPIDITPEMRKSTGSTWMLTVSPSGALVPLAVTTKTAGKVMVGNKTASEHIYDTVETLVNELNTEFIATVNSIMSDRGVTEREAVKLITSKESNEKFDYRGVSYKWSDYVYKRMVGDTSELTSLIKFNGVTGSPTYFQLVATNPTKDSEGKYIVPKLQYNRKEVGTGKSIRENITGKEAIMEALNTRYMLINPEAIRENSKDIIENWLHVNIVPGGDIYADPEFKVKITDPKVASKIESRGNKKTVTEVKKSAKGEVVVSTANREMALALDNTLLNLMDTPGNNFLQSLSKLKGYSAVYKKYSDLSKDMSMVDALIEAGLSKIIVQAIHDGTLPSDIANNIIVGMIGQEIEDLSTIKTRLESDDTIKNLIQIAVTSPVILNLVENNVATIEQIVGSLSNTLQNSLSDPNTKAPSVEILLKNGNTYNALNGRLETLTTELSSSSFKTENLVKVFANVQEVKTDAPIVEETAPISINVNESGQMVGENLLDSFSAFMKKNPVESAPKEIKTVEEKVEKTNKLLHNRIVVEQEQADLSNPFGNIDFKLFDKNLFNSSQTTDLEWFKKVLPNVPISILESLAEMSTKYGTEALGVFDNNMVAIVNGAMPKVVRHEAFHAVFNLYLKESQRDALLKEASKYAVKGESLTEFLADAFMNYAKPKGKVRKGISSLIRNFFKSLLSYLSNRPTMNEVFEAIDNGYFANKKTSKQVLDMKVDMTTLARESFESIDVLKESLSKEGKRNLDKMLKSGEIEIKCD